MEKLVAPSNHSLMKASQLLRQSFARFGLLLQKTDHPAARYFHLLPDSGLAYGLHRAFDHLEGLNFLQVGANDGQRADPLLPLIEKFHWSGTLVEPRPVFVAALQHRHAHNPKLLIVQAAIAETSAERSIYYIRPEQPGLPDWAHGLATLDAERIATACRELGLPSSAIGEEKIRAMPWDALAPATALDAVAVLVIDTEGYDIPLLKLWNWQKWHPRVIHFEHACASAEEHFAILQQARQHGYEAVTERGDTTLFLPKHRE